MKSDADLAREEIRRLSRKRQEGDISEEEYRSLAMDQAKIIVGLEFDDPRSMPDLNSSILRVVEMAERNPAIVHAIAFGIIAAAGHYVRSRPKEG